MALGKILQGFDAATIRRLFPAAFYAPYLAEGVRPDGRPTGDSRDISIGLDAVPHADSSALVKLGTSAALAAIRVEVVRIGPSSRSHRPSLEAKTGGYLRVRYEMPEMCMPSSLPQRGGGGGGGAEFSEASEMVEKDLDSVLSHAVDPLDLVIVSEQSAWAINLDVICLDADGSNFDCALLASLTALSTLELPSVRIANNGRVTRQRMGSPEGQEKVEVAGGGGEEEVRREGRKLSLRSLPMAITIAAVALGNRKEGEEREGCSPKSPEVVLLVDPTAEEESMAGAVITIAVDSGVLFSSSASSSSPDSIFLLKKMGGSIPMTPTMIQNCLQIAHKSSIKRRKELEDSISAMDDC